MAELSDQALKTAKAVLDAMPYGKLEDAAQYFGITTVAQYQQVAQTAREKFKEMQDCGIATHRELEIAALKLEQAELDAAYAVHDVTVQQYSDSTKRIKEQLDELDGKAKDSTQRRTSYEKSLAQQVQDANRRMFDSLSRDLASNIVNWKGWGDTIKSLWKTTATDLLDIMMKTAIQPLEKAFGKLLGSIFGTGGSAASTAASTAGGAASGAGGIAGSVAGAASSGLMGIVGAVASVGSLVTSIIGLSQGAHENTILERIEGNTRGLLNVVFLNGPGTLVDCAIRTLTITGQIRDFLQNGLSVSAASASPGAGAEFAFVNCSFSGVTQDTVSGFMNSAVRQLRAAGANI
jgi:hypothetical protein